MTGATFDDVEVTVTDDFRELYPDRTIPPFSWLKPIGVAGQQDFGAAADGRLVVSEHALNVLSQFGTENALVEPYEG